MKVTLLNPLQTQDLFYWWGVASKVCYDTKTDNPSTIGKHCMNSGHFSGSRSQYILFQVDDCPRFTIDQIVRHEEGVMKNVQSFRYVGKNSFAYEIPVEIKDNEELLQSYIEHMFNAICLYDNIQSYVYAKTNSHERANEQARYVLPISTHSSFVIGMDIEALIHFCNTRLCVRTEDIHRELAKKICDVVLEVLPGLKEKLVPNCQYLLWCPEGRQGCGAYPTKKELKEKLNLAQFDANKGLKVHSAEELNRDHYAVQINGGNKDESKD